MRDIFTKIYQTNYWGGRQSRSGSGSDLEETENIRRELPFIFRSLDINSILDIPCGDLNWWKEMKLELPLKYIGADIVPELVEELLIKYDAEIMCLDITQNTLPKVDAIFTRDCLGHLSSANVVKAVENVKRAKPKYFIATHWPEAKYKDIQDGGWRKINMTHYLDDDFEFIEMIEEDIKGKYLGVWELV